MRKIFSGEVFFALFLFSGVFKESIGLPIDLSAVFLFLTIISIFIRLYKQPYFNKVNVLPVILFIVFIGVTLLSFFYTPNLSLTQDKIVRLLLLTTPAFVFPFFLFKSKGSLTRFLITIAAVSTVVSLFSLPMVFDRGANIGFVGFNDGNYQGLSRLTGVGVVLLLFLGVLNDRFKKYRLIFLVSIGVVLISLFASGSRMPIIALVGSLFIIGISSIKIKGGEIKYPKYYNKIFGVLILLTFPFVWAYQQGFFNSIIYRFEVLLQSDGGGASASSRVERFNLALKTWEENFIFGNGFGSFGDLYTNTAEHDYPHNLFLELLSELGIVGLVVFSAILFIALFRFYRLGKIKDVRNNNLFIAVAISFIVVFINAMVSQDVNGNRVMFTFIAIMCALPLIFKKEVNKIKESTA